MSEFRRAIPLYQQAKDGPESVGLANVLSLLGSALLKQQKWTEAEAVLHECLTIHCKKQPDDWETFNTRSALGGALLGRKRYAEAEPLLLEGYEGMKRREAKIPQQGKPRLTEALGLLVRLYEETGKQAKAAKWRKLWDEAKKAAAKDTAKN